MRLINAILFCLVYAALVTCQSGQVAQLPGKQEPAVQQSDDEILFILFSIARTEASYSISIDNIKVASGSLREHGVRDSGTAGQLKVAFINGQGEEARQLFVDDPLDRLYESFGENGTIEAVTVKADSASFFVRTNNSNEFQSISFYKVREGEDHQFLTNIQLPRG